MTVDEVAQYLSVNPSTIYRWVRDRQIPYVPMHGLIRFIETEIDEWMSSRAMGKREAYSHLKPETINA